MPSEAELARLEQVLDILPFGEGNDEKFDLDGVVVPRRELRLLSWQRGTSRSRRPFLMFRLTESESHLLLRSTTCGCVVLAGYTLTILLLLAKLDESAHS
ncbi:hypothetical protein [Defluviimonas salinarum]|uniref:Uncharacterized protein n=1 Tax=Defluviimonas salinarum TaxID=2992147 RepID=A0ABT3J9P3_9RHOB|nr:hypothetical protein [Defluviimonas salinarum]MCW3784380.1 hypothetical protein [Defluviimonas salinarum]